MLTGIGRTAAIACLLVAQSPAGAQDAADTTLETAQAGAGVEAVAAPETVPAPDVRKDFTFRRVGLPTASVGKRITVQVDPDAEMYRITPGQSPRRPGDPRPKAALQLPEGVVPEAPTDWDWYWALVSPDRGTDSATRFSAAMATIQKEALKIGTPRLQMLQGIIDEHGSDILMSTVGTQVSPALVLAVIAVESGGKVKAKSHAGAQGIMQLMPATAERFGVKDSLDPSQNIKGGVAYLDWLMNEFNRDPVMALAGYNAGEGAVMAYDGVPPYAETRGYVPKVLAAWNLARTLCSTTPDLVSDGCVFVGPRLANDG